MSFLNNKIKARTSRKWVRVFILGFALSFALVELTACSAFNHFGGGRGRRGNKASIDRGGGGARAQTSVIRLENVIKPLRCIKKAVAAGIPGGVRRKSENRRTYYSKYTDLNGQKWDMLSRDRWRAYAEVTMLGDRRPYTIEVQVRVEERKTDDPLDRDFKLAGKSGPLAGQIAQRIELKLDTCRGDLIDEFRAF